MDRTAAIDQVRRYFRFDGLMIDNAGLMMPLDDSSSDVPCVLAIHHADGYSVVVRHDLPKRLIRGIQAMPAEQVFDDYASISALLMTHGLQAEIWQGVSYLFPATLSKLDYPDAVQLDESHRPLIEQYSPGMRIEPAVFAIIADQQIVATCESSRENALGGEAWVQTLPAYRGRGYARQVTAAWARHLMDQGKTPYYSHRAENVASQGVARRLRLIRFMREVAYT
jgi:RimJ/RimL family protein N-acetyltransferase